MKNLSAINEGKDILTKDQIVGMRTYTLLWTNPSPQSDFPARTVPLDLSEYEAVEVWANWQSSVYFIPFQTMCEIGQTVGLFFAWNDGVRRRFADVTSSGVEFDSGYFNATNNSVCIPYKIYGIKSIQ